MNDRGLTLWFEAVALSVNTGLPKQAPCLSFLFIIPADGLFLDVNRRNCT